jgi:carbon storage regulator
MLVLTRRVGETIMVGDDIEVEVLEVRPGIVRLGVRAPKSVRVLRSELVAEVATANAEAVSGTPDLDALAALKPLPQPVSRNGHRPPA